MDTVLPMPPPGEVRTMRAVQFDRYGPPDVMHLSDVDIPHAGPSQVRVAVRASSLAPGEMQIRAGARRDAVPAAFPFRCGFDAAGIVDEVGAGVIGTAVGDEVFGFVDPVARGANAEHAVLVAWASKPAQWSWAQAGAAGGSSESAGRVLDRLDVRTGELLLVAGASGAVGSTAVQLAVARGALVIGTASAANSELVASLGAAATTYGPGLARRVEQVAAGLGRRRVDAVLHCAGDLGELVAIAGRPRRVVTISDPRAAAMGVHLSHGAPPAQAAALGVPADPMAVHALAEAGRVGLQVLVAGEFALEDVVAAARVLEGPHAPGKVVLTCRSDPLHDSPRRPATTAAPEPPA